MTDQPSAPGAVLPESKLEATSRLRREGRWDAFYSRRDELRAQLRTAGASRAEANAQSWDAAIAEFPPPVQDEAGDATEGWPFSWPHTEEHHLPSGYRPDIEEAQAYLLGLKERVSEEAMATARREMEDWHNLGCNFTHDQQLRVNILLAFYIEVSCNAWSEAMDKAEATSEISPPPVVTTEDEHLAALLQSAGQIDSFLEHVRWAYQQAQLIIKASPGKSSRFEWQNATSPPPGPGAIAYVKMADSNPAKFYGDIVPKALGDIEPDAPPQMPARDQKIVGKFKTLLSQLNDESAADGSA